MMYSLDTYTNFLTSGRLNSYLTNVDRQAQFVNRDRIAKG